MEREVAERLKVSRTPVRDALRRLESEGMLAFEPRIGIVVASITRQAMLELYVVREVLEGTAARLCARHASDVEVMELEELVMREQRLQGNHDALAHHNKLFHQAVHLGAHNRYLEKSLAAVNDSMSLLGESQMRLPARAELARSEHAALVRCDMRPGCRPRRGSSARPRAFRSEAAFETALSRAGISEGSYGTDDRRETLLAPQPRRRARARGRHPRSAHRRRDGALPRERADARSRAPGGIQGRPAARVGPRPRVRAASTITSRRFHRNRPTRTRSSAEKSSGWASSASTIPSPASRTR